MLREVCSIVGGVTAGPIGSLIGGITGGLLGAAIETVVPGASGVITNAAGAFGSEAYRAMAQRVLTGLPPEERSLLNHDLQRAFRFAVIDALAEMSGQERAATAQRDPRGVPPDVRFPFDALPVDLREPMRNCFADLTRAVTDDTLFPITAPAQSNQSVTVSIDQTSLAMLSGATSEDRTTLLQLAEVFYDETIDPWLITHSGFYTTELAPLKRHLRRHLLPRTLVHFNERIKAPENTQAWRAFNRTLLEQLRTGIAEIQVGQRELTTSQRDLAQKVDRLLRQSTTSATLPAFAGEMGAVIAAVGTSTQSLEETITTAFARITAEQAAFQAVLRDALARIEQKVDVIGDTTTRIEGQLGKVQRELERSIPLTHIPWRIAEEDITACPYPGLAVFGAEDASYFFGRDMDIARLVRHANRPIVAVTGPSGVGKSSFVLAGVLPHLRTHDPALESIVFRVSTSADLLRDLAATLATRTGQPTEVLLTTLQAHDRALREMLLTHSTTGRVVLVLDQFEELFVGTDKARIADRARLLDLLLDIEQHPDPRLLVILTSRENYLEHPDYLARPDLRPIVLERGVALAGLSDLQLRDAILKPLNAFNAHPKRQGMSPVAFESGVIELFEQEFRRTERTLPLVQYLLRLLWTERRELSIAAYTQLGGLERALDRHASKIYETFSAEDQRLIRALLLALVRPGIDNEYTRRRVARDDLIGTGSQRDRAIAVVGRLASQDSRIISEQQVGQVSYLELTHEILLKQWERLRVLIDTYRERLETREVLLPVAEQWHQSVARTKGKGDSTYLYRGSQLRQAKAYTSATDLPEGVDTGIQTCYLASVRYQRRQIISVAVGTIVVLALLGFGINWYTTDSRERLAAEQQVSSQRATAQAQAEQTAQAESIQRTTAQAQTVQEQARAQREAELANAQRLANLARQTFTQGDRPLALALALEANSINEPPLLAQQVLADVAYSPGYAAQIGPGSAISPDGAHLLNVLKDGRVLLREVATGTERELGRIALLTDSVGEVHPPTVQFSADSSRVVIGSPQEIVSWGITDGSLISRYAFSDSDPGPRALSINPYQATFLMIPRFAAGTINYTNEIQLRDLQSGRVLQRLTDDRLSNDTSQVGAFAPDGRHVFVGGGIIGPGDARPVRGEAAIWDTESGAILGRVSGVTDSLVFGPGNLEQDGVLNVAFAGDDDAIHLWSYASYAKEMQEGPKLSGAHGPLLWSSTNGFLIATKSDQSGVYLWNLVKDAQLLPGIGTPLELLANGTQLALQQDQTVVRYDLAHAAQMAGRTTPSGRADYIGTYSILTAPDGTHILTGDNQSDSTEFNFQALPNGERTRLGEGYLNPIASADRSIAMLSLLPPSSSIVANRGTPQPVYQVFDLNTGVLTQEIGSTAYGPLTSPKYPRPAISADGQRAIALIPIDETQNSVVIGLDLGNKRELQQLGEAASTVANLAISPDGTTALVLIADGRPGYGDMVNADGPLRLLVWDIERATLRGTLDAGVEVKRDMQGFYIEPTGLAYSADGSLFALTVAGSELHVWDAQTLNELWQAPTPNNLVQFSPDSQLLLSAGRDGQVQLLSARTGALTRTLGEARGPALFNASGDLLITGDSSQQVRVWDVATGAELRRFPIYADLLTLTVAVDGKSFFTGSADGMKQWRNDTLAELITWTKTYREVVGLSCEQRTRYQIQPLCPAGTTATPGPAITPIPATPLNESPTPATVGTPLAPTTIARVSPSAIARVDGVVIVTPPEVGANGTFRITTEGFTAGEEVNIIVRQPDGIIYDGPFDYTANASGVVSFEMDYAKVNVNNFPGVWTVSVEGTRSGRRTSGQFNFVGFAASPTPAPPLTTDELQGLVSSEQGSAVPPKAVFGTLFRLTGWGFMPDEPLTVTFRYVPSDVTKALDNFSADSDGSIQIRIGSTKDTGLLGMQPPGLWECVITGKSSQHVTTIYFIVSEE